MKKQNRRITSENKNRKKNIKSVILLLMIAIIMYLLYSIINLVIKPVDVVLVEEGKIYSEETTVGYVLREEEVVSRTKL